MTGLGAASVQRSIFRLVSTISILILLACLNTRVLFVVSFTLQTQRIRGLIPAARCFRDVGIFRQCSLPFCVFNAKRSQDDDDENNMIESQARIQNAVQDLLQSASIQGDDESGSLDRVSVPDLEDFSSFEAQQQLISMSKRNLLPEQEHSIENFNNDVNVKKAVEHEFKYNTVAGNQGSSAELSDGFQVDSDGVFLDTDDYLHSRDWLNPDGSLSIPQASKTNDYKRLTERLLEPSPNVPDSMYSTPANKNPTIEDLMKQPRFNATSTSEELHKKVFEGEEGYLQQSEVFRKALTSDREAKLKAMQWRRGAKYRERQAKLLSQLDQEIQDFEDNILEEQDASKQANGGIRCSKCGCLLSSEEIRHMQDVGPKAKHRICQVCNAEKIQNAKVPRTYRAFSDTSQTSSSNAVLRRKRQTRKPVKHSENDINNQIKGLMRQVQELQSQVEAFEHHAEIREGGTEDDPSSADDSDKKTKRRDRTILKDTWHKYRDADGSTIHSNPETDEFFIN